ncbi:hypothetical protein VA7868_01951 [Vibrio aerogenes CECT 7868]|uniref:Uncharacterized protein n=1 Tax=Vibrio aerogenes CECT 7868 TaxID=1216006 RepID=A0A1M5YS55_9VIBR|nr:hypothetical protein [Vibrio aerogenes]SHI14937.1 hypothetical protein VA7868_01951 [Vibrio aerogenes CECT 7868]
MLLLLFVLLWTNLQYVSAGELDELSREQLLQSSQILSQLNELHQLLLSEKIDELNFSLQRISLPGQEAARYLLLKRLEQEHFSVSLKIKQFVRAQQSIKPAWYLSERKDGYTFTVPAFDFPAVSGRLLRTWKHQQNTVSMLQRIRQHNFELRSWLSGDEDLVRLHESLLIQELERLTDDEILYLTHPLVSEPVTSWLPSTRLMSALARRSKNAGVYKLLWLMKPDGFTISELNYLSVQQDAFAVGQIIKAANNPGLKLLAIKQLTRLKPMPDNVKHFLIRQMSRSDTAEVTARSLVKEGYGYWLQQLIQDNKTIKRHLIKRFVDL